MSSVTRRYGGDDLVKKTLIAFVLAFLAVPAMANTPTSVIEEAVAQLDQKLTGQKAKLADDRQALYELIDSILLPRFDRVYAAQLVLGKHWRRASDDQQRRFIHAFYKSLLRRYADGVLEFDPSRIQIQPFIGDLNEKRNKVQTIVLLDDGTKVPVDYWLVNRPAGWLMFDVRIEGISYVQNFRAELNSEIQAKGLEKVIKRLEAEAAE